VSREDSGSFVRLADLKGAEEHSAAERLRLARERLDHERRNLTKVQGYLAEYSVDPVGGPIQTRLLVDRHRFRLQLERTIEVQQVAVEIAERQAEQARAHWASVRSEHEALRRLSERRRDAEVRREIASDQKLSDEQAMQAAVRSRGSPD
jgi:flagellar export protein FliJ